MYFSCVAVWCDGCTTLEFYSDTKCLPAALARAQHPRKRSLDSRTYFSSRIDEASKMSCVSRRTFMNRQCTLLIMINWVTSHRYHQMAGRSGRAGVCRGNEGGEAAQGIDAAGGESFLILPVRFVLSHKIVFVFCVAKLCKISYRSPILCWNLLTAVLVVERALRGSVRLVDPGAKRCMGFIIFGPKSERGFEAH